MYCIDNFMCKTCLNLKIRMSTVKTIFLYAVYKTQMPMFNNDWFLCQQCNNILENPYRVWRRIFIESHRVCSFDWENGLLETNIDVWNYILGRHDRVVAVIILFRFLCIYKSIVGGICHRMPRWLFTTIPTRYYYIPCRWPTTINYNILIYYSYL